MKSKNSKHIEKILIINPYGIGDCLFTTPLIQILKSYNPDIKIAYLVNERTAPIFNNNPHIEKTFIYEKDTFRKLWGSSKKEFFKQLSALLLDVKREKFDCAVDFSMVQEFSFFCWLAGIKKRIGYNFKNRGVFLTDKLNLTEFKDKHIVEFYTRLLSLINISVDDIPHLSLFIPEFAYKRLEEIVKNHNIDIGSIISVAPGAGKSWGKDALYKHWPEEHYSELLDKITGNFDIKVLLIGDSNEKEKCERIKANCQKQDKIINVAGETNLLEAALIFSKSRVVITNDGGLLHVAVAVNASTVSIFGPVDENVYGPYPINDKHIAIKNDTMSCRPCYRKFKFPKCIYGQQCLKNIKAEAVFKSVCKILK